MHIVAAAHGAVRPNAQGGRRPAVIDDFLELALEHGNLIAFVEDGQLHEFGGIAMLRS